MLTDIISANDARRLNKKLSKYDRRYIILIDEINQLIEESIKRGKFKTSIKLDECLEYKEQIINHLSAKKYNVTCNSWLVPVYDMFDDSDEWETTTTLYISWEDKDKMPDCYNCGEADSRELWKMKNGDLVYLCKECYEYFSRS